VIPTDLTPAIIRGNVIAVLRSLPAASVQCVVTSPPYWGLRAYGTEPQVWGGVANHAHEWDGTPPRRPREPDDAGSDVQRGNGGSTYAAQGGASCRCGAWRGELGSEPTPELYVAHLGDVFNEVRRVVRADGTLWLNLGDTYTTHPAGLKGEARWAMSSLGNKDWTGQEQSGDFDKRSSGLPEKNLVGIPWAVAFELRRRGWYLRSDVVWAKPNPMPESVTDRPTRAHEYVFLFAAGPRYFYDADAVREAFAESSVERAAGHFPTPEAGDSPESKWPAGDRRAYPLLGSVSRATGGYAPGTIIEAEDGYNGSATKEYAGTGAQDPSATKSRIIDGIRRRREAGLGSGANLKSVWRITTQAFRGAHFATFPEALPDRCIRLGTSERGACPRCGAPWRRETEHDNAVVRVSDRTEEKRGAGLRTAIGGTQVAPARTWTVGWAPSCSCGTAGEIPTPVPCVVLDPFTGSGTVPYVARRLGRRAVGIDLNPEYVALARRRCAADVPDLASFGDSQSPGPSGEARVSASENGAPQAGDTPEQSPAGNQPPTGVAPPPVRPADEGKPEAAESVTRGPRHPVVTLDHFD
jgi:DNA modification methylase